MISEKILNLTDLLAESLIVSDLDDLQEVGKIYDLYLKISEEAKNSDMSDVAQICDGAIDLVKQVMMDDNANKEEILQKLNDSISKIQYVSRSGYQDRVDLPKETVPASNSSSETLNKSKIKFQLPEIVDEDIFNDFLSEQNSVLDNIETLLLSLETVKDKETLNNLRRVFHTLKGESAVFGLNDIARICHLAEDLTETPDIELPIDKLLTVKDWFKDVFDALKANEQMPELDDTLLELFQKEIDKSVSVESVAEESAKEQTSDTVKDESSSNSTDKIIAGDVDLITDFVAEAQEHIDNIDSKLLTLETDPEDAEILNAVFRVFHTLKGAAGFLALDDIAKLAHTTENLLDLARKRDLVLTGNKIDVVFEAIDQMNELVANIRDVLSGGLTEYPIDPNLDILIEKIKKVIAGDDLESEPSPVKNTINEMTPASEEVTDSKLTGEEEAQPEENNKKKPSGTLETTPSVENISDKTKLAKVKIKEAIKIDSENLDRLVDAIGELVIIESMITQDPTLKNSGSAKLLKSVSQMNKITRELQQLSMSLRMIPVRATFQKMARVVRDLSKKSDKLVVFNTNGEDTMLDKSVVDRIGDPLIHLVRNSVDHGIELSPEDRVSAGKDKTGQIELNAFHKGGNIHIEITDDGRGLDREAILKKAMDKGLIREGQSLSEREIYNLILLPGFSTAKKVTDVSGRGVGMDVVKRNIEDLRGNIEISSEPGNGSLISLKLPLTLAIIDGMLVRIGNEKYIIPTLSVVKSVRPEPEDISTIINRGEMIKIRDDLIPLFRLSRLFNIKKAKVELSEGIVVIVEDSGKMTGLLVDELLGQQSTVIKNLGASMKGLTGISGGSILSDGQVGLILDVAGIIKIATTSGENNILNKNEEVHVEV